MPKLQPGQVPSLRRHKATRRCVVTLNGKDHYLGFWPDREGNPSPDVAADYERLAAS